MSNQTVIEINPVYLGKGDVRIDVTSTGIPAETFGAAFDLQVKGSDFELVGYNAGEVFKSSGFAPLMLAVKKGDKIVTGLSLKGNDKILLDKGNLISYFINIDNYESYFKGVDGKSSVESGFPLQIGFSKNVLSGVDGKRFDLSGVKWIGYEPAEEKTVLQDGNSGTDGSMGYDGAFTGEKDAGVLQGSVLSHDAGNSAFLALQNPVIDVYLVMILGLSMIFVVLVFLWLKSRVRPTKDTGA